MPRVNGIFQLVPGTYGAPGSTVQSAKYNAQIDDFGAEMNAARPITAGGTGAQNEADALTNLGAVNKAGDRLTGSLSSKVVAHGTKGSVTEEFKYGEGNTHSVTVAGALVINPTGLAEGDVMQVSILYQSGSIDVSGTTQWELGAGVKGSTIASVGVTLVANAAYRIIFEVVAGVRTAVFQ